MMNASGLATALLTFLVPGVLLQCQPRDYGKGSVVCVCDTTQCDFIGVVRPEQSGVIAVHESSKAGKRFDKTTLSFNKPANLDGNDDAVSVVIDSSKKYQSIFGFGGAFTDAAGINLQSLPEQLQEAVLKSYYSDEGLSYNMGRVPMASCDFSARQYTYNDVPGDLNMANFALAAEDFSVKIPYIKRALNMSKEDVWMFGSPWSGPAWMKTSGKLHGAGQLKGRPGGPYYEAWAKYITRFLQEYEKNGIRIWGLTVENEPSVGYVPNFRWQSMGFTPSTELDFIKMDLGPALLEAGYGPGNLTLMIMDDQRSFLPNWANVVLGDPEAAKFVQGVAVHWYANDYMGPWVLDKTHNNFPDKFILATEACEGWRSSDVEKVILGSWNRAENYAHDILEDLLHWATGWVDWNLALDLNGGPNWANNFVDSPIIVNATGREFYKQPMYYALAHFSKVLPRGSVRVDSRIVGETNDKLEFGAFKTPENATVLIVLNTDSQAHNISVQDVSRKLGTFTSYISERSMRSFIWW
uniref:Glucosylceramidase n=1 Tax=Ixodes scapularis TaxID=6945 RepID=A0A4D5RNY4_IXOSC